jgi:subtilisin family serine protease
MPAATSAAQSPDFDRQVLVMLRLPASRAHAYAPNGGGAHRSARRVSPARRKAESLAGEFGLTVLDEWPMPALNVDCYVMQAAPGASRERLLRTLASDARVESAQPMQVFKLLGSGDPLYPAQPAAARWHLRELHGVATGKGVIVAQVDSGVAVNHPDLRGQIAVTRNLVPGQDFVAEAHGTEVAGIIAARADNGIGIAGIAPQARLLALRACWQLADASAQCSSFTLAQALQFALRAHAQVINLSLSGPRDPLLARLLDVALRQGASVVAAVDAQSADGGFPASHPGVLAVASTGDPSRVVGAVQAPGRDIPTTRLDDGWGLVSGSSFAAAQVSGLAALLLQTTPTLNSAQLREALAPAPLLGLAAGAPAPINACAAIERSVHRCICACGVARGGGTNRR